VKLQFAQVRARICGLTREVATSRFDPEIPTCNRAVPGSSPGVGSTFQQVRGHTTYSNAVRIGGRVSQRCHNPPGNRREASSRASFCECTYVRMVNAASA
jgi:hypothetical protein